MEVSTITAIGVNLIKGATWFKRKLKKQSPEEILRKRKKLREELETHLIARNKQGLRKELIIRDVDRMDDYPNISEHEKGISAWFKVGIKGVSYRGLEVFLSYPVEVVFDEDKNKWRFAKDDQKGELAFPVGKIPYENIVEIDWNGDEYYPQPHIYCRFSIGHEPYYAIHYYFRRGSDEHRYYEQIEGFEPNKKKRFFFL